MVDSINDNDASRLAEALSEPDAHGQAAMLLVESLLHGLVERSILSPQDVIEIIEIAADAKVEIAAETGEPQTAMQKSLTLLRSISASLQHDLPTSGGAPDAHPR